MVSSLPMRLTIPHSRTKQEARDAVDRSIDQMFNGLALGPIEFLDQKKQWLGDTMNFALTAKLSLLKTPIQGSVMVGEREITIDVDLGLLAKLLPENTAKTRIENRVKGLLT